MEPRNLALVTALRHALHAHPELAGNEVRTRARLQAFLAKYTNLEVVDRGNWFYAVRRGIRRTETGPAARPAIAFRAEMDAVAIDERPGLPYASTVPGISHACGHDGHCAVLAALALEAGSFAPDRDVYFLFQHAEETGQGAAECAALLDEEGIEELFAFHNMAGQSWGVAGVRDGVMNCASQGVVISLKGAPAHASLPETGRNPAFAAADLVRAVPEIIGGGRYTGRVWCAVIQVAVGSANFGIAAGEGSVSFTCRGEREADMHAVSERLVHTAGELARRDGLAMDVSFHDVFPETANHPESAAKVRAACEKSGVPLFEMPEPMRASEDVGHFFKAAKGALFLLYTGDTPPIHTPGYDFDDALIERAVALFKELAS